MLYNIRKFHYVDGTQVRLYKRPVLVGKRKEDICDGLSGPGDSRQADNDPEADPGQETQAKTGACM